MEKQRIIKFAGWVLSMVIVGCLFVLTVKDISAGCNWESCKGDGECNTCCGGDPNCTSSCNEATRTCAVTYGNLCEKWGPWSECNSDFCMIRYCDEEEGYPYDMQVASCGGGVCGTATTGCFLPGTLVKGKAGDKKIEDLKVGDRVASFENGKVVESKVSQIYK